MKNELGITKGKFRIVKEKRNESIFIESNKVSICHIRYGNYVAFQNEIQADASSNVICESLNVANETGKTPRQLADDNKVLLEALKEMIRTVNPTDVTPNKVSMGVSLGEYYVGGCSFPSDKSIHMAINAIKQVTE